MKQIFIVVVVFLLANCSFAQKTSISGEKAAGNDLGFCSDLIDLEKVTAVASYDGDSLKFSSCVRFTTDNLESYDGEFLAQIKFVPVNEQCSHTILIYTGGSYNGASNYSLGNLELVYPLDNADLNIGEWNTINLPKCITIDGSKELMICVEYKFLEGSPAIRDGRVSKADQGDLILTGGELTTLSAISIDGNWLIKGVTYNSDDLDSIAMAPSNFTVTPAAGDSLFAKLSWINPLKYTSGLSIEAIDSVVVKRDGEKVFLIENQVPGSEFSWTDSLMSDNVYDYAVLAYTNGAKGISAKAKAKIGKFCEVKIDMFTIDKWGWGNAMISVVKDNYDYGVASRKLDDGFGVNQSKIFSIPVGLVSFYWTSCSDYGYYDHDFSFTISDAYGMNLYSCNDAEPLSDNTPFFIYDNTCATPEMVTISGAITDSETSQAVSEAVLNFKGLLSPVVTTNTSGEYSVELVKDEDYYVKISANDYESFASNMFTLSQDSTVDYTLKANACNLKPISLSAVELNATAVKISWTQGATIKLEANNVLNNETGYQLLIDSDAASFGSEIIGDSAKFDIEKYDYSSFEYTIPTTANPVLSTEEIVANGTASIIVPEGIYDYCLVNPDQALGMRFAGMSVDSTIRNNYKFENGKTYNFSMFKLGTTDAVSIHVGNTDSTMDGSLFSIYKNGILLQENIKSYSFIDNNVVLGENNCYYVVANCANGLSSEKSDSICIATTAISENSKTEILLYPNPATENIIVGGAENCRIDIMNIMGEIIATIEKAEVKQNINLDNFAKGIYFAKINNSVFKFNVIK